MQERAARPEQFFNWYYAAVYGTGAYKVGEESVAVVRAPLGYRIRESTGEQWGVRITLPVSAALAQFDLQGFNLGKVDVAGVSALPGVEVEIPLNGNWRVTPFVNAGGGWDLGHDASALIYSAGASTRYRFPAPSGWKTALGGSLTLAGYEAGREKSRLGALSGGGDVRVPLASEIGGRTVLLGVQVIYTVYFNRLEFLLPGSAARGVLAEAEIALTLGVAKPYELLGASFDRVGLGYVRGSGGLRGLRLATSFPF